jgi:hypothetical protein
VREDEGGGQRKPIIDKKNKKKRRSINQWEKDSLALSLNLTGGTRSRMFRVRGLASKAKLMIT